MKPARMRLLHNIRPPTRKQQLKKLMDENDLSIWLVCMYTGRAAKSITRYLDHKDRMNPPQKIIDDVKEMVKTVEEYYE